MKTLAIDKEARLTYLKRELVKSVTHSRYFNQKTCCYNPPRRAVPARVKQLAREIRELEGKQQKGFSQTLFLKEKEK